MQGLVSSCYVQASASWSWIRCSCKELQHICRRTVASLDVALEQCCQGKENSDKRQTSLEQAHAIDWAFVSVPTAPTRKLFDPEAS